MKDLHNIIKYEITFFNSKGKKLTYGRLLQLDPQDKTETILKFTLKHMCKVMKLSFVEIYFTKIAKHMEVNKI